MFFHNHIPRSVGGATGDGAAGGGEGVYTGDRGGARWGVGVRCGELMGGGVMGSGGATGASNLLQCRRGPEAN